MSFLVESLRYMMDKDNLLIKVESIICWEPIADNLQLHLGEEVMRGQTPYNYLSLFKVLLLQQWHQLSDPKMEEAIDKLHADKGYASEHNREFLQANNIGDGIMHKARRNNPLTNVQINRNKEISKTRYIVERTNATTKNIFGFSKTKYIGIAKVKTQALLIAIAHNLLKAANKICLLQERSLQILRKQQFEWIF